MEQGNQAVDERVGIAVDTDMQHVMELTTVEVTQRGTFVDVLNCARTTVSKEAMKGSTVKESTKTLFLFSEHSPIRELDFMVHMTNLPSWIATHYVRHHVGAQPYVSTQRDDRVPDSTTRRRRGQSESVEMRIRLNSQGAIDLMHERLCTKASKETRFIAHKVRDLIVKLEPSMQNVLVAKCVYRGYCPEFEPCSFCGSSMWNIQRGAHLNAIKEAQKNYKEAKHGTEKANR